MAVFDPKDWWGPGSRPAPSERPDPRRAAASNRLAVARWGAQAAFCLCFAALGPPDLLAASFAGLMLVGAFASAAVALLRGEHPLERRLTAWDEAAASLLVGLGVGLGAGPPPGLGP